MMLADPHTQEQLELLKQLAREYFTLEKGEHIEDHTEILHIFDIQNSRHDMHPHNAAQVCITRRALKHTIESRKEQLLVRHTATEAVEAICFALDHLQEAITDFDAYTYEPPTHYYQKDYANEGRPILRIALDLIDGRLQIKSIHFTKRT